MNGSTSVQVIVQANVHACDLFLFFSPPGTHIFWEARVIAYHLGHVVGYICSLGADLVAPSWKNPATIIWFSKKGCIYICYKNEQSQ